MGMDVADLYDAAARAGLLTHVRVGPVSVRVAFRAPDENVLDGLTLSRDYEIEYPSAWLDLAAGETVEVGGETFRVREVRHVRDGSETVAKLAKL